MKRREFVRTTIALGVSGAGMGLINACAQPKNIFEISLAQWSLHRGLEEGAMDPLDFAALTREKFGLNAIEYVNKFCKDRVRDQQYLKQMRQRADDAGVRSLLIMCDDEGRLGDPDESMRLKAVENHYKWVEAAAFLGCHSIRVNAASEGSYEEQLALAADGLNLLCAYGDQHDA